jgi:tetratricopeptide (TPR) repeat protein
MKNILLLLLILITLNLFAQKDTAIINLEKKLETTQNVSDKLDIVFKIATKYNVENPVASEAILRKGIFIAEESRDREMMIKARRYAGNFYTQLASLKEYSTKALSYTNEALELCKKTKGIEAEKIASNIQMAKLQRRIGDNAAAKKYNEAAIAIAEQTNDDSLSMVTKLSYGHTQLANGDKLEAFKTFVAAQTIAEKSKHKNKEGMQVNVYNSLAEFYKSIEDYDKALDYQYKTLHYFKNNNSVEEMFTMMYSIGSNYIGAKKYDAAKTIYEEMIVLADSLKKPNYKVTGQIGILNTLITGPEKDKTIAYLKTHPEVKASFEKSNMGYQIDFGTAEAFTVLKQYDSAKYYFDKTLPILEKEGTSFTLPAVYLQYSKFLYESGKAEQAINYLKKSIAINDSSKNTSANKDLYQALDSCYQKTGDYKNAMFYNGLYQKARVDEEEKSKAKDILTVEIDTENKRKERLEKEAAEATITRRNWQYMGIIVSILSLFILLATIGIFNVPIKWIRALGFISFIFLFEFIILLADNWIHDATHGEPWKVLAIKVVLIAMLLPLHHYLEHKVVAYLTQKKHQKDSIGKTQMLQ